MKYDRTLSEIFQLETEKYCRAAEREADTWTFWVCMGIVFLLFYMEAV